jgi:hypothetical protein
MSLEVGQPVTAAATTQVKLYPYDEKPALWFRLLGAQFPAAGINANTLARLPKQVLWDILDTVYVCNDSGQPFDQLTSDTGTRARACLHCKQSKTHCHARLLTQHIAIPLRRFTHLHIDLVGPFIIVIQCAPHKLSPGNTFIATFI